MCIYPWPGTILPTMYLATDKLLGVNGAVVTNPMKLSAKPHTDIAREAGDPKLPPHQFSSPLFKYVLPTSSFRSARATIRARDG
ncbi:hypothetical protein BFJ66_g17634 [Fusarium oxysporum f. sp. cepae]|nr:hypothetical protein BFJ66_g17634 [Fusarium oxysporum f. sp. cepae]